MNIFLSNFSIAAYADRPAMLQTLGRRHRTLYTTARLLIKEMAYQNYVRVHKLER